MAARIETTLGYLTREGKTLMLHRIRKAEDVNAGKWIGIGGHIEEGESPEDCMRRELLEETGLTAGALRYRGIVDFNNTQAPAERMHLFTGSDFAGELTDCDEGVLAWIPDEEILSLPLWEGDRIFLKDLTEREDFFHLVLNYEGDTLLSYHYED